MDGVQLSTEKCYSQEIAPSGSSYVVPEQSLGANENDRGAILLTTQSTVIMILKLLLTKAKLLDLSLILTQNTLRCAVISFLLFCSVRIRLNSKRNMTGRCCTMYTLNRHGHKCLLIKPLMSIIIITVAYSEKPLPLSEICESPARFSSLAIRLFFLPGRHPSSSLSLFHLTASAFYPF